MAQTGVTYRSIYIGTKGVVGRESLRRLKMGKTANPRHRTIVSLAGYFQVDPAYFFEQDFVAPDPVESMVDGLVVELGKLDWKNDPDGQRKLIREFVAHSRSQEKLNSQHG